jgi:CRISPR-associated endoribonuclease Cas6
MPTASPKQGSAAPEVSPCPPAGLTAHCFRFEGHAGRPILLNEHKGSAIRGALFHALRGKPGSGSGFCVRQELQSCHPCSLHSVCPISALVATVRLDGDRGVDPPRPLTIEPPLERKQFYGEGERFSFGLTLFGHGVELLPYVVAAARDLERIGLGQFQRTGGRSFRGTFVLDRIAEMDPLTHAGVAPNSKPSGGSIEPAARDHEPERDLWLAGAATVASPAMAITSAEVTDCLPSMPASQVTLDLLTPTRLTEGGALVRRMAFRPLVQRLFERSLALAGEPVDTSPLWPLLEVADAVEVTGDRTRWVELDSYSTRRSAHTPLSGLVGRVTFSGPVQPFLPWLVWGQVIHVGKEATKGNGWYRILTIED